MKAATAIGPSQQRPLDTEYVQALLSLGTGLQQPQGVGPAGLTEGGVPEELYATLLQGLEQLGLLGADPGQGAAATATRLVSRP